MSRRRFAAPAVALAAALALAGLAGAEPAAAPIAVQAVVEQPRAFGYVLGDVFTQRMLLQQEGRSLEPGPAPAAGRIDRWLERRPARIETDARGRRWLAIDYQLVNAPLAPTVITVAPLELATASGPRLALPAWPIGIGPLTPPGQGDLPPLQPDRPVEARETHAIERQLQLSVAALLGVAGAWLVWWLWRNARDARNRPFARAWRELRRIDDLASLDAWRVIHRGLNASAGCAVHAGNLPRLLAQAPYLRPLQVRLDDFYRESTQRFFAVDAAAAAPAAGYPLRSLCRALRDAERRT
ncbi:MAG: hypothetical protein FWG56_12830 [Desulfovibrionaceae bacterium]|nr:hypothetical protein [Desulfovibrionaceae bacterium]